MLLDRLQEADKIDWSSAAVDSSSLRAVGGGDRTGPNPTDRRKNGSKHHVPTDAQGIPLDVRLTATNRHDVTRLIPLVDAIPPIRGKHRAPRRRPKILYADQPTIRTPITWPCGPAALPRRSPIVREHGSGLGVYRWVVERTNSWLHQYRRLRVRYERRGDMHEGFFKPGCILIRHKCLVGSFC